ncbi:protein phosphatase CheZ [Psychromonas sp. CD1]|uniref:protein phosphatase CheZ n=1 Tax=Psychromonas sp. CD1 TaxID=1979839 RepID=UPI000B9BFD7B|nr:protein phosphatase CheZ [Psychromonas sp. CD1]
MGKELIALISLDQAKTLVAHLEDGEIASANDIFKSALNVSFDTDVVFEKVGELTRELHDALLTFQNDTRLIDLAGKELPDAKDRLNYVIEMTGDAANKTMDAVDLCIPIADKLISNIESISPHWQALMSRQLALGEFKQLCAQIDDFFKEAEKGGLSLKVSLTDILMAQGFQDLTGQIIGRVISLVQEIELKLVKILKVCSMSGKPVIKEQTAKINIIAEGPIMDTTSRDDVVNGQDEVDDLLSSLGF